MAICDICRRTSRDTVDGSLPNVRPISLKEIPSPRNFWSEILSAYVKKCPMISSFPGRRHRDKEYHNKGIRPMVGSLIPGVATTPLYMHYTLQRNNSSLFELHFPLQLRRVNIMVAYSVRAVSGYIPSRFSARWEIAPSPLDITGFLRG